ncbi:MAG: manganese efflux pump [Clostridia bacterium]|nr:manganese efflux pump [Clostridia bacterium]
MDFLFVLKSVAFGAALAMDAFSVSMANGLNEPSMKRRKILGIAAMFAFFQALMPMIGWICVHTVAEAFSAFNEMIPWIALVLLSFIGGKMLIEGIRSVRSGSEEESETVIKSGFWALVMQGIATSIDALSVGFDIAGYDWLMALICALIIAAVTFFICWVGVLIGRTFGTRLSGKASIFGGVILIAIGLEIFISGLLG